MFEPKKPVELAPPKDDPITLEYLAKCDGEFSCPVLDLFQVPMVW